MRSAAILFHLMRELVLFFVGEAVDIVDDMLEIILDKEHRRGKLALYGLLDRVV